MLSMTKFTDQPWELVYKALTGWNRKAQCFYIQTPSLAAVDRYVDLQVPWAIRRSRFNASLQHDRHTHEQPEWPVHREPSQWRDLITRCGSIQFCACRNSRRNRVGYLVLECSTACVHEIVVCFYICRKASGRWSGRCSTNGKLWMMTDEGRSFAWWQEENHRV